MSLTVSKPDMERSRDSSKATQPGGRAWKASFLNFKMLSPLNRLFSGLRRSALYRKMVWECGALNVP